MEGRGFANRADLKAAGYIASVMEKNNVAPLNQKYLHPYTFSANTFPGAIELRANNRLLRPQHDYFYSLSSPAINKNLHIERLFGDTLKTRPGLRALRKKDLSSSVVITDMIPDWLGDSLSGAVAAIFFQADSGKALVWRNSDAAKIKPFVTGKLAYNTVLATDTIMQCIIENQYIENGEAVNVAGIVKGRQFPNRWLMITAHYDHLGLLGKGNYYPGGNDNASGVAMMLDLARHYARAENQPDYSMMFVAFSGEESGLWGSYAFAASLPVPADSINVVLNLDMVGTGSAGITTVNGEANPTLHNRMVKINSNKEYIATVKNRGSSCNSDHCPFDKLGIPALFVYSMGKEWPYYHVPDDTAPIPLTEYSDIFLLVRDFLNQSSERVH
ncbi:MAG: hypothetical protein A2X11_11665 [Bacteroidetes bacterium GWE2_42_24]|nr:MAG: hypothetical protein A2X11_11665 [Bacteroidetes bacterium GWE2_42_24]